MLSYARLTPGAGFRPERALAYYAQRAVTQPAARRGVSALIAGLIRARRGVPTWPLDDRGERALAELRTTGVAVLEPFISEAEAGAMRAYFEARPVRGADGSAFLADDRPSGTAAAGYGLETVLACPGLVALLNRPEALGLSAAYLGCKPTVSSVGVRWTFPLPDDVARFQDFHRDVDDWRFLKLFIYLTDVDEGSGAHVYVRGSHLSGFRLKSDVYTDASLEARYGEGAATAVVGRPGTTFMADTLGVHRGGRPVTRPRLILQVQYSLLPVFAFLYEPLSP